MMRVLCEAYRFRDHDHCCLFLALRKLTSAKTAVRNKGEEGGGCGRQVAEGLPGKRAFVRAEFLPEAFATAIFSSWIDLRMFWRRRADSACETLRLGTMFGSMQSHLGVGRHLHGRQQRYSSLAVSSNTRPSNVPPSTWLFAGGRGH